MAQTIGTGGGAATRQFSSNLYRVLTLEDLKKGPANVADYLKIDAELNSIFKRVQHADPTVTGAQSDGNFSGAMIQTTTPSATGSSNVKVINHGMGRIPVGWQSVGPAINGAGTVNWRQSQAPDANNLYLYVVAPTDTNIVTSLIVW